MQEKRKQLASRDATIVTLQNKLSETEAALEVLEEERSSLRKLTRQAWRTMSSRIKKRVGRIKRSILRKNIDELEEVNDTNGEVNNEAATTLVALGKK